MKLEFTVAPEESGLRLDVVLARKLANHSRAYLQKLIRSGALTVDGVPVASAKTALKPGMALALELPEASAPEPPAPEAFAFPILYEDESMVVIDKPAGVVVHPAPGNHDGTVVNALLGRYPELRDPALPADARPGIVHRLDKDTSGCLVAARTVTAQSRLSAAFANRETHKCYLALVAGVPLEKHGRICNFIGRHPVNRQKMAVVERNGKEAISEYEVLRSGLLDGRRIALVKVRILTGRTHQIRVHMASLGCPVLGDALYGGARSIPAPRQMLHAWKLALPHPVTGELLQFEAPVPEDFMILYRQIETGEGV